MYIYAHVCVYMYICIHTHIIGLFSIWPPNPETSTLRFWVDCSCIERIVKWLYKLCGSQTQQLHGRPIQGRHAMHDRRMFNTLSAPQRLSPKGGSERVPPKGEQRPSPYPYSAHILWNESLFHRPVALTLRMPANIDIRGRGESAIDHKQDECLFQGELRGSPGRGFEHQSTWGFEHVKSWEQDTIKTVVTCEPHSLGPP